MFLVRVDLNSHVNFVCFVFVFARTQVLASSSGDVTVCTKPVARGAAANDSSDYDDSIYSSQPDTARLPFQPQAHVFGVCSLTWVICF